MDAVLTAHSSGSPNFRELLVGLGSPKISARQLTGSAQQVIRGITAILDEMLLEAIEKRTRPDFIATRNRLMDGYIRTSQAMGEIVSIAIPKLVLERIASESFSELESDFRELGVSRFGASVRDQAIFTVWTFRKINDVIVRMSEAEGGPDDIQTAEFAIAAQFKSSVYWAQFHLDCLAAAVRFDKSVYPEVLSEITAGLQSAVNAYSWIRQSLDLRIPPPSEPAPVSSDWDEEDQKLLDSSMKDIATEHDGD